MTVLLSTELPVAVCRCILEHPGAGATRQEPPVPTGLGGQSGPCEEVLPEAEAAVDHRAAAGSWASARVVGLTGAFVSAFVVSPT